MVDNVKKWPVFYSGFLFVCDRCSRCWPGRPESRAMNGCLRPGQGGPLGCAACATLLAVALGGTTRSEFTRG